jgi:peptidoglycan-N-acetylglucosamine deacetylase
MSDSSAISSTLALTFAAGGAGIVSFSALMAYSVFSPRCQFWAPVIRSLPQREAVALTFDDGPHPEFTPRILDILREQGTRASFFVIGRFAQQYPAIIRRIHAEGHTLGNHTLDHDRFGINRNRAYWQHQLLATQEIVADITGRPPLLFRPPMGFKNWNVARAAREMKLPVVGWSVRGYDTRVTSAESLAARLLKHVSGHDIVVLHDGVEPHRAGASQEQTVEALPALLDGLREKKLAALSLLEALAPAAQTQPVPNQRVPA